MVFGAQPVVPFWDITDDPLATGLDRCCRGRTAIPAPGPATLAWCVRRAGRGLTWTDPRRAGKRARRAASLSLRSAAGCWERSRHRGARGIPFTLRSICLGSAGVRGTSTLLFSSVPRIRRIEPGFVGFRLEPTAAATAVMRRNRCVVLIRVFSCLLVWTLPVLSVQGSDQRLVRLTIKIGSVRHFRAGGNRNHF